MKKAIITITAIAALSCAIYAGMIYFADQLPVKTVTVDDRPEAMKMIDDYYGNPYQKWKDKKCVGDVLKIAK